MSGQSPSGISFSFLTFDSYINDDIKENGMVIRLLDEQNKP